MRIKRQNAPANIIFDRFLMCEPKKSRSQFLEEAFQVLSSIFKNHCL